MVVVLIDDFVLLVDVECDFDEWFGDVVGFCEWVVGVMGMGEGYWECVVVEFVCWFVVCVGVVDDLLC